MTFVAAVLLHSLTGGAMGQLGAPSRSPAATIRLADLDFFAGNGAAPATTIPPLQLPPTLQRPVLAAPLRPQPGPPVAASAPPRNAVPAAPKAVPQVVDRAPALRSATKTAASEMNDRLLQAVVYEEPGKRPAAVSTADAARRPAGFLAVDQIPTGEAARRRFVKQLLAEGRAHLASGDLAGAQDCANRASELAVVLGRFDDTPKALHADIAKAALRRGR